jgi:hypothetical protein
VRAADLDHDGRLDLAVSDNHGSGVQLAYGLPDGGFVVGAAPGPGRTYGLDVADLDGDGALDLVTTLSSSAPYQVQVYFGDGARGFSGPLDLDASTRPQCVHVADVDGDGRPDLVACTTATGVGDFRVYLGQADGGFADGGAHPTPTGEGAWELVATDLGSGVLDVVTANRSGGTLTLFRGDGAGGFGQPAELPVGAGAQPYGLVADDFDHLHGRDLAYADNANGRVGVLLNQGNGTFRDGGLYPVGAAPLGLVVGDFSHTGEPSLAVGVSGSDEVRLLINDGSGAFRDGGAYGVGSGRMPEGLATGDFNADGKLDLAVANYQGESVGILLGR